MRALLCLTMVLVWAQGVLGFNGHEVRQGPLRLEIGEVVGVREYDRAYDLKVTASNSGSASLEVRLRLTGLVDEWYAVGAVTQEVTLPKGSQGEVTFRIAAGPGACSGLYPVRVEATFASAGSESRLQAVRVFETRFERDSPSQPSSEELGLIVVPEHGVLMLTEVKAFRAGWRYFDRPEVRMPIGWHGSSTLAGELCGPCRDAGGHAGGVEHASGLVGGAGKCLC